MRILTCVVGGWVSAHGAIAADVALRELPGPIEALFTTPGKDGSNPPGAWVRTSRGDFRLSSCHPGPVCWDEEPMTGWYDPAPAGALPDGWIATSATGDIRRAWYGRPTARYDHGVIADAIEGGSLVVETADGKRHEFVLPETHVFEDLAPRVVDLDRDGRNEVIAIRSSLKAGSAIAVYGMEGGRLALLAASEDIGRRHRWMNVVSIAHFSDAGARGGEPLLQIASIITPHIGGPLVIDTFQRGNPRLKRHVEMEGPFSNHAIGSRALAMAHYSGGKGSDFLPLAGRREAMVSVRGGKTARVSFPSRLETDTAILGGLFLNGLEDGRLAVVRP